MEEQEARTMRLFFTFCFMLLFTVPLGIIACRYFSDGWWMYLVGFIIGLMGANIANIIFDAFLKPWIDDDGN